MAYGSNETGQAEIFVQPVAASGAKWQISTAGGVAPRWRRDGTELFYVAPDQHVMAVSVKTVAGFEAGSPEPLAVNVPATGSPDPAVRGYAATRDGQRFLVNVPAGGEAAGAAPHHGRAQLAGRATRQRAIAAGLPSARRSSFRCHATSAGVSGASLASVSNRAGLGARPGRTTMNRVIRQPPEFPSPVRRSHHAIGSSRRRCRVRQVFACW